MTGGTFTADLKRFENLTADMMMRVAKASLQDVIRIAQTPVAQGGKMPVDTGYLRNSLVSSLDGRDVARGPDSYVLAIIQLQMGQPMEFAWMAEYAVHRHYMVDVGQGGGLWRDDAAQQWPQIVAKNARRVR